MYDAVKHLAKMLAVLGPPNPALIRQRSQSGWRWSPAIENQTGELCNDACSFYGGPFFDPASCMLNEWICITMILTSDYRRVYPSECCAIASELA